jgi:hypothetical protein
MKKLVCAVVLLASTTTPMPAAAQGRFDGTWQFTLEGAQVVQKDTMSLQNGVYRCPSCDPPLEVDTDGRDHKVTGSPYFDTTRVVVVSDHVVKVVNKKAGATASSVKLTASADGKTLTSDWTFVSASGQTATGQMISARLAPGPAGSHTISGTWQPSKVASASDNTMRVTFTSTPDGLSMNDPLGNSYDAKFDGKDYPYKGDPGTTSVSLKKINANTIEETDKRGATVTMVVRITASADGKTLTMNVDDRLRKSMSRWVARKAQ